MALLKPDLIYSQLLSHLHLFLPFYFQLALPVSPKNSNLNTELLLSLLSDMTESTTDGFRVRAEIHFARANYLAAMQNYLEVLILSTNYFSKPWLNNGQMPSNDWDERIFQKMIKCTSELGHHHQVRNMHLNGNHLNIRHVRYSRGQTLPRFKGCAGMPKI